MEVSLIYSYPVTVSNLRLI